MRAGGKGLVLFSAGVEIYTIYQAPEEDKEKVIAQAGGRFGGGILGGMAAGALMGGYSFTPMGVAAGLLIGGFVGFAAGEWVVNLICSDEKEDISQK